ncbi:DNA polymerase III subunit epsilon [Reinekea sp.]|jgi:DNA polymerase-3 subunit epsilon|uniref:DNA polymerase III subunit epsilon n=1 Tax=Reinekea sp. TaxID=1970455 RepID=UPI0039891909
MRQVVLDTETTGLNPRKGDRILEVGCVELIDRKLTGRTFHYIIDPERDIPDEVVQIHNIDNERVKGCPKFYDIADELWQWLEGAELVIHNAAFDMGFLNAEYEILAKSRKQSFKPLESVCSVLDTLKIAREKHPGSRASLDALCKRYGIDNSHRTFHGALLDSEILADVYLMLTGGQTDLLLGDEEEENNDEDESAILNLGEVQGSLREVSATADELKAHAEFLEMLAKKSGQDINWPSTSH